MKIYKGTGPYWWVVTADRFGNPFALRVVLSQPRKPMKIRTLRIGSNTLEFMELAGFPDVWAMLKVP